MINLGWSLYATASLCGMLKENRYLWGTKGSKYNKKMLKRTAIHDGTVPEEDARTLLHEAQYLTPVRTSLDNKIPKVVRVTASLDCY